MSLATYFIFIVLVKLPWGGFSHFAPGDEVQVDKQNIFEKETDDDDLDYECAKLNDEKQREQFPEWIYAAGGSPGDVADTSDKQSLESTWEPILEPVPGCNGLAEGLLKTFTFLVVLDSSWIEYYNDHDSDFAKQGYNTLEESPYLLIDRTNYLFERQLGIRMATRRIVSFPNLKLACRTNNGHSDDGTPETSTKWHLNNASISTDNTDAGILRLGTGLPDNYCHSSSPLTDGCNQNGIAIVQRKPFYQDTGRFVHRAAVTLAHEWGHFFGMCPWGRDDCTNGHTSNNITDIMVDNGMPAFEYVRDEGMFFKFFTTCTNRYDDIVCQNIKDAPTTCGVADSATTCRDKGKYSFLEKKFCTGLANKVGAKYARYWQVKKGTKNEVLDMECKSNICEQKDCCKRGPPRKCINTDNKGLKEGGFTETMCGNGWKLKPLNKRKKAACKGKKGQCMRKNCCVKD